MSRKLKLSFLVLGIALALVAILPLSAAVQGTLASNTDWATVGSTITVTLTDPDLDVAGTYNDEATDYNGVAYTVPGTHTPPGPTYWQQRVQHFPILDRNGDGIVNFLDVVLGSGGIPNVAIHQVSASDGLVTFVATTAAAGSTFDISYKSAIHNTATIKVSSSQDTTGFNMTLRETGPATGVFSATVKTAGATATSIFDEAVLAVDINGDGDQADVFKGTITCFYESAYAADLNGDSTADPTGTVCVPGPLNEVTLSVDLDGDGLKTNTAVAGGLYEPFYGVDFNLDGDTLDGPVTSNNVAASPTHGARPEIAVANGSIVTFTYQDASPTVTVTKNVTVETNLPTVAGLVPAHNYATSTTTIIMSANITDSQSGVDSTSTATTIAFKYYKDLNDNGFREVGEPLTTVIPPLSSITPITGGFKAEVTVAALTEGVYRWWVEAKDKAGNLGRSDSDTATAGDQDHRLKIDTTLPSLASPAGYTGDYWDATTKTVKGDLNTSLSVIFDDALDGTSIDATDFTIAGVTPAAAFWTPDLPNYVFLTVSALGPSATPTVVIVGQIRDAAGNVRSTGSGTIADGIAPTLTYSLNKSVSKDQVQIEIGSNETLLTNPTVSFLEAPAAAPGSPAPALIATNTYRWTYNSTTTGSYTVQISATDTAGNIKTVGVARCATLVAGVCTVNPDFATKGIVFEIDSGNVPAPVLTPANGSTTFLQSPFLTINFAAEGTEYGINALNAIATTGIVTNTDTHKKVTITKATLDGLDISGDLSTADNILFLYAAKDLALGKHTLVVNAQDEAGNTLAADATSKFEVKVRPPYEVPLVPGMNLVSLPGTPNDPSVASVMANTSADLVMTYDPINPMGPWLIAQKTGDTWSGSLNTIDGSHAYWVRTSSFAPIKTAIPELGSSYLPPAIPIVKGWNLVPVQDILLQAAGTNIPVNNYLANVNWAVVYTFNTTANAWTKVVAGGNLQLGKGYWVYANAGGVIAY